MRKKRFSVEQMVGILKQAEVGVAVRELVRREGISEQPRSTGRERFLTLLTTGVLAI